MLPDRLDEGVPIKATRQAEAAADDHRFGVEDVDQEGDAAAERRTGRTDHVRGRRVATRRSRENIRGATGPLRAAVPNNGRLTPGPRRCLPILIRPEAPQWSHVVCQEAASEHQGVPPGAGELACRPAPA